MEREMSFPFEFSVIMAVYNVEPFLKEAVDSLIAQDFGFEKIQLIMVDDGSTDGSGAICDAYAAQYPGNVMVIHKENGGVSSARNAGLQYATGRYYNFMDSDDKLETNVMSEVYGFFEEHANETDVAAIPLFFFDGQRGQHPLNRKFAKGNRVIDLYREYSMVQLSMASTFVKADSMKGRNFDCRLSFAEDAKLLIHILMDKGAIGAVSTAKYCYRKRTTGERSAIQQSQQVYNWYLPYIQFFQESIIQYCEESLGYVPKFVQYTLAYDLQWRFKQKSIPSGILTEQEEVTYKEKLKGILQYLDDSIILEQKNIWIEHKCYMLSIKYGCAPTLTPRGNDVLVHFKNTIINRFSDQYGKIEFVHIQNGTLTIEGFTKILGVDPNVPISVFLRVNDEQIPCEIVERNAIHEYSFDDLIYRGIGFKGQVRLDENIEKYSVFLGIRYNDTEVIKRDIRYGMFSPVSSKFKHSYFCKDGWCVSVGRAKSLEITRCGRKGKLKHEVDLLRELWNRKTISERKAVLARIAYHILKLFKKKEIWLISDRIMVAGDNGEALFRYMVENHKEVDAYYILSEESVDFQRMKKTGPVVKSLSFKHKLLHLLCDYNISSHADVITNNPFSEYFENYRDIMVGSKFVFLQHGVIKDNLSGWLNKYNKNISGFITAANPEYQSILAEDYAYSAKEVWLTGLPRFDRLYYAEKKYITFMPTWRRYVMDGIDNKTGIWKISSDFTSSTFFQFYSSILRDQRLLDAAEKRGYRILFMPHPTMQPYVSLFAADKRVKVLNSDFKYRDIYAQSNLIVTDYSSAVFDFAYLRKPIIYSQFDKEEFFSGSHTYTKGYFDYERDGFGEVEYDLESTVTRIIEYMEHDCQLKEKYLKRIDDFFAFNDKNNCQRVYNKILKLTLQENE